MGKSMSNEPGANKELTANIQPPTRADRIAQRLNALFSPGLLQVEDESGKHKGHAGSRPEGETHFLVTMQAEAFAGLSRVARQRLVNDALKDEFAAGLHALALKLKAPGEAQSEAP
jgi:BolA family transcriptional regulator, general stress-responsive regulator